MSGFGSQPFGSSPYGLGTPAVATDLGGATLADQNGVQQGSRRIDPLTKDYVLDDTGRIAGMANTHQLVLLAVSTTKGTAAMRTLGHELKKIERISANFVRRVDTTLRACVQHLVLRGLIEVVGTSVQVARPGVGFAKLNWRDLTSGSSRVEETPVG
jgi:hypothetical protein